jgi:acetyl esterase/lipase
MSKLTEVIIDLKSTVIALKFRDLSISGIIGQILNIPVTCHPAYFPHGNYEYRSYEQNKNSPIVNATLMHWFWNYYLPDATPDPYASPLLAESLRGLPPSCQYTRSFPDCQL